MFVMTGTDIQVKPHLFQKGHAKMGGRQKGSKNRPRHRAGDRSTA
jgi:hypothetical protein